MVCFLWCKNIDNIKHNYCDFDNSKKLNVNQNIVISSKFIKNKKKNDFNLVKYYKNNFYLFKVIDYFFEHLKDIKNYEESGKSISVFNIPKLPNINQYFSEYDIDIIYNLFEIDIYFLWNIK